MVTTAVPLHPASASNAMPKEAKSSLAHAPRIAMNPLERDAYMMEPTLSKEGIVQRFPV
jgi:hypothetical protein